MQRIIRSLLAVAATGALLGSAPAGAVDGVIELNQAFITAGGGFPYQIGSGSFVLTGSLTPPSGSGALLVIADDVTIDLNGFTIDGGSGGCTGSGVTISCPSGAGIGINAIGRRRVTVRNGFLRNFASDCISLGTEGVAERLHVTGCSVRGIDAGAIALVRENITTRNGGDGIGGTTEVQAVDNVSFGNGGRGIRLTGNALVSGNVTEANGSFGISTESQSRISHNVAAANELGGIDTNSRGQVEQNVASSNPSGPGILAQNDMSVAENVTFGNGSVVPSHGIDCNFRCSIVANASAGNTNDGIQTGGSGLVQHNATHANAGDGIDCDALSAFSCAVVGNFAQDNVAGFGLRLTAAGAVSGTYKKNLFTSNLLGNVNQSGIDPGMQNSCAGTVPCP
ncbi:MAG: right-handed parallel beta-helix repeat-containing protein [Myxococcota bacterium]